MAHPPGADQGDGEEQARHARQDGAATGEGGQGVVVEQPVEAVRALPQGVGPGQEGRGTRTVVY